jgi:serine protease AprX
MRRTNPSTPQRSVAWSRGASRRSRWLLATTAVAGLAVAGQALGSVSAAVDDESSGARHAYIVQTDNAYTARLNSLVHGGFVNRDLPLVDGVAADLTDGQAASLARIPGVTVTPDVVVRTHQVVETPTREATAVFPQATGADRVTARGVDGSGVTVAVVDTGITRLPELGNRVVGGVDLSGEFNPYADNYGHGTFVAGVIAGKSPAGSGEGYVGEAPGAKLLAVKVAGASGETRMSTVIAGISWAILTKPVYGTKVLNISLGADATPSTTVSPLNRAVEKAWDSGIVVVASAGNYGPGNGSIAKPGDDPLVITAGASDDRGTATQLDDTIPSFSSVGPTWTDGWFKPDLVAPGKSVVSLRTPGSTIDTDHPEGRVGTKYFKGSGTSFSAAVTSGAAALVLQANPGSTPDAVKGRLLATAGKGPVGNPFVDGFGLLDVAVAAYAPGIVFNQANVTRFGGTSLADSTGTVNLGSAWNGSAWNSSAWNGSAWNGAWNGSAWNGSGWNGSGWNGSGWNGSGWNGSGWNGSAWNSAWNSSGWNGSAWNGSAWNGSAWNGSAWNGSAWNGSAWNGSGWNGSAWNGSGWNGSAWNGSAWNGSAWNGSGWNGSAWNGSGWNGAWN